MLKSAKFYFSKILKYSLKLKDWVCSPVQGEKSSLKRRF